MKNFDTIDKLGRILRMTQRTGPARVLAALIFGGLAIAPPSAMAAFSEATLFGFNAADGSAPGGQAIQASDGNYYGVTCKGGPTAGSFSGVVWKITPAGQQTVLHAFAATTLDDNSDVINADGDCPQGLAQGADRLLYGLTRDGGSNGGGVAFKLALDGSGFTVLHNFGNLHSDDQTILHDGSFPYGTVIPGIDGNFYGTTLDGGAVGGGSLFRVSPSGTYQLLYSFGNGSDALGAFYDGLGPIGTLVQGADGNFYGVTYAGGVRKAARDGSTDGSGGGTAYRFDPSNSTVTVLHAFKIFDGTTGDGYEPFTNLVTTADGAFYGMAAYGGSADQDNGTLFRISSTGAFTLLSSFTVGNSNGTPPQPRGLTLGSDGRVYGTTLDSDAGRGSVFQLVPNADGSPPGALTTLYQFAGLGSAGDGTSPNGPLVQGSDGAFFGTLFGDGPNATSDGGGAVFRLSSTPALAPPVQVTLTPATITLGQTPAQTATLSWKVLNATSNTYSYCFASDAWNGLKGATGSTAVAPTTPGTYRYALTCAGVETGFASLTVLPGTAPAPTVTIAVNPTSITLGATSTLSWSSTNASACTASGAWSGSVGISGSLPEKPTAAGTATYTLTCTGAGGTATRSATLTVAPVTPAPTVTIAVNPTAIALGSSSTLAWSSTNATACTASNAWSGSVGLSGSASERPAQAGSFTYTLTCTGAAGSATGSATLTVAPAITPAPTVTIGISPASITLGNSSTLTWSSTNATACTASGAWSGEVGTSGSMSEQPPETGSFAYTLTCTGAGGSAARSATLEVDPNGGTTGGGTTGSTGGNLNIPVKSGGALGLPALLGMLGLAGLRRRRKLRALLLGLGLSGLGLVSGLAHADSPTVAGGDLASQLYGGARLGVMDLSVDRHKLRSQLAAAGYQVDIQKNDDAFAGMLYLGYALTPLLGVEFGYTHRDDTVVTLRGASPANLQGLLDTTVKDLHGFGDIFSASLRVHGEVLRNLLLTPRFGVIYWDDKTRARADGLHASASHSGGGVTIGAGLSYRIWRGLEIGAGVDYVAGNPDNDAALYAGSIEWDFGH